MGIKILAVIPARGGSKGIPRKNIKKLNGKPLIYYSIDAAKKSKLITDFIVFKLIGPNFLKKLGDISINLKIP